MNRLSDIPRDAGGVAGFTRDLGYALERRINQPKVVRVTPQEIVPTMGYMLYWKYGDLFLGEIMVTAGKADEVVVDRFLGFKTISDRSAMPSVHRAASDVYDRVDDFLIKQFGHPLSEHDGRTIFASQLGKKFD